MDRREATAISDRALSVPATSAGEARRMGEHLRGDPVWQDVVPGIATVSVLFDPVALPIFEARERLLRSLGTIPPRAEETRPEPITIPVHYGDYEGPDLTHVSRLLGLSEKRFVELHTAGLYEVEMMGFLPGFAYLGGLDPKLAVARRAEPRLRVPAGAVAIGGDHAGIYSLGGSGGWQVIGRTDHPLFDPQAEDPFALKPGMSLRFEAIR